VLLDAMGWNVLLMTLFDVERMVVFFNFSALTSSLSLM
jgi:hypothetical protein